MIVRRDSEDGQHYKPGLFREIEKYQGTLFNTDRNLAHPMPLAVFSWTAVERALAHVIEEFDNVRLDTEPFRSGAFNRLLDSHSSLIARVTEFIETVSEKVASCFIAPKTKLHVEHVERDRQHVAMICNAQKHNQKFLVPVLGTTPTNTMIWGFAVYEVTSGGLQKPNKKIHPSSEAFSLPADIKRALGAAYFVGENVGAFIKSKGPVADGVSDADPNEQNRISLLKRVAALPNDVFPFESERDMPLWDFSATELVLRPRGGRVNRAPIGSRMTVSATPHMGALSIKVPT